MKAGQRRLIVALASLASCLGLVVTLEFATYSAVPAQAPARIASAPAAVAVVTADIASQADQWLNEIQSRPLFEPNRRPAETVLSSVPGLPRLSGIVSTPGGSVAIFQDETVPKPVALHRGDRLGEWTITDIDGQSVHVEKARETIVLTPRFVGDAAPVEARQHQ